MSPIQCLGVQPVANAPREVELGNDGGGRDNPSVSLEMLSEREIEDDGADRLAVLNVKAKEERRVVRKMMRYIILVVQKRCTLCPIF